MKRNLHLALYIYIWHRMKAQFSFCESLSYKICMLPLKHDVFTNLDSLLPRNASGVPTESRCRENWPIRFFVLS